MTKAEIFARRLREAMRVRGVKQVELAKMIDTKPATISRYLSGKRLPSVNTLSEICEKLNVTSDFLMGEPALACLLKVICAYDLKRKLSCETCPFEDTCLSPARVFKEET